MKEVIYLEKSRREVLNTKVAEGEKQLELLAHGTRVPAFHPGLLDRREQLDSQRRNTLNENLSAAYRPCEETKQANDIESQIRTILRPLIRFVEDFAERQQSDSNDNYEHEAVG
jgi:hypothetical protein